MTKFVSNIKPIFVGETGTTSVEYAVMLALIIGICIGGITVFGGENGALWGANSAEITTALK